MSDGKLFELRKKLSGLRDVKSRTVSVFVV